jgi:hypothetical protein
LLLLFVDVMGSNPLFFGATIPTMNINYCVRRRSTIRIFRTALHETYLGHPVNTLKTRGRFLLWWMAYT